MDVQFCATSQAMIGLQGKAVEILCKVSLMGGFENTYAYTVYFRNLDNTGCR